MMSDRKRSLAIKAATVLASTLTNVVMSNIEILHADFGGIVHIQKNAVVS